MGSDFLKNEEETTAAGSGAVDENVTPRDPLMVLLPYRHIITGGWSSLAEQEAAEKALLEECLSHQMAPLLRALKEADGWAPTVTDAVLASMDAANESKVAQLAEKRRYTEQNQGESEVQAVMTELAQHYYRIGDVSACLTALEECTKRMIAPDPQLDACFMRIRLGFVFLNNEIAAKGVEDAHRLLKESNWERRNRLKVYEGLYYVLIRDFAKASELLLDCISTFASEELLSFEEYIIITIVSSLPVLSRQDLKRRVLDSPEVAQIEHTEVFKFAKTLYDCQYRNLFPLLESVCLGMRRSPFLAMHINYFFREARVLCFAQFLQSYSSVTLRSMSAAFDIPEQVLDELLSTLISNDRLPCRMDGVSGSIRTYGGDETNFDYHRLIKNGDLLLNRLQKLTQVVEV